LLVGSATTNGGASSVSLALNGDTSPVFYLVVSSGDQAGGHYFLSVNAALG
jgi:hypothetical protein